MRGLGIAAALAAIAPVPSAGAQDPLVPPRAAGLRGVEPDDRRCLTEAIYYEAATEPDAGQAAVAGVVLNRLRDPRYPKTICGVVYQGAARRTGCQFTFTCDGALARRPAILLWRRAQAAADRALDGSDAPALDGALNYHAFYVAPTWRLGLARVTQIGSHIFYRPRRTGDARIIAMPGTPVIERRNVAAPFTIWGLDPSRIARNAASAASAPTVAPPLAAIGSISTVSYPATVPSAGG